MDAKELIDECNRLAASANHLTEILYEEKSSGHPINPEYVSTLNQHAEGLHCATQKLDLLCKGHAEPKRG